MSNLSHEHAKVIGAELKSYRVRAKLTQAQLAKRLGFASAQPISNVERGVSNASTLAMAHWCCACGMPSMRLAQMLSSFIRKELNERRSQP